MKTRGTDEAELQRARAGLPGRGVLTAAVVWSLAWKGASLWHAAKDGSKPWFVALLVSNTLGVLDAVYLFGVRAGGRRARRAQRESGDAVGATEQLGRSGPT